MADGSGLLTNGTALPGHPKLCGLACYPHREDYVFSFLLNLDAFS